MTMAVALAEILEKERERTLRAFNEQPYLAFETGRAETSLIAGGYSSRQFVELLQNAFDAIIECEQQSSGRVQVILEEDRIYVANNGAPLDDDGLISLLSAHLSTKRNKQIGRFGLGFKALAKWNRPVYFFSRAFGNFYFDPERCRKEICERCPNVKNQLNGGSWSATDLPAFRLAWPLEDPKKDETVTSLQEWAESIIVAEIPNQESRALIEEIRSFRSEILLFLGVPIELILKAHQYYRQCKVEKESEYVGILRDAEKEQRWFIIRKLVKPSEEAKIDATEVHARNEVELSWAFPLFHRPEAGRLWAWFPTQMRSGIGGELNGPWKLNTDRSALVQGEWNDELFRAAAEMIVEAIPTLYPHLSDDPGAILDILPRRLEGEQRELVVALQNHLWDRFGKFGLLPNANGRLSPTYTLYLPPGDLPEECRVELVSRWTEIAAGGGTVHLDQWIHPRCVTRERWARLSVLAKKTGQIRQVGLRDWVKLLASSDPNVCVKVLEWFADVCQKLSSSKAGELQRFAEIVPAANGCFKSPRALSFGEIPSALEEHAPASWLNTPDYWPLLERLGLKRVDEETIIERVREILSERDGAAKFWEVFDDLSDRCREKIIEALRDEIKIKRADGQWVPRTFVLLSPEDANPEEYARVTPDWNFHDRHREWLMRLGVAKGVDFALGYIQESPLRSVQGSFDLWAQRAYQRFSAKNGASPWPEQIYVRPAIPGHVKLLEYLEGEAAAKLTKRIMELANQNKSVVLSHVNTNRYSEVTYFSPLWALLMEFGEIKIQALKKCYSLQQVVDEWEVLRELSEREQVGGRLLLALEERAALEEAIDWLREARQGMSIHSSRKKRDLWNACARVVSGSEARFGSWFDEPWQTVAEKGRDFPEEIFLRGCLWSPNELWVSAQVGVVEALWAMGKGALFVGASEAEEILRKWGGRDPMKSCTIECPNQVEEIDLEEFMRCYPEVCSDLRAGVEVKARLVRELSAKIDGLEVRPCLVFYRNALFVDREKFAQKDREFRVFALVVSLPAEVWKRPPKEILRSLQPEWTVTARRRWVSEGRDHAERLLRAVGGKREALLGALPEAVQALPEVQAVEDRRLAQLVLDVCGGGAMRELADAFEKEGLHPPQKWGGRSARDFVRSIGLPDDFAASASRKPEPEITVRGVPPLPNLHDYQEEVLEALGQVMGAGHGRRRALVSLPTGAGKTRVVMEAVVKFLLKTDVSEINHLVIWVAQSEELCEQAVTAAEIVWKHRAPPGQSLRICRLYGGVPSPAKRDPSPPTLVVATIQTLNSRAEDAELSWLKNCDILVIDECHHAVAPSYSRIFRFAGAGLGGERYEREPVVVGLTATPFRADDEESRQLAGRFDVLIPECEQQTALYEKLSQDGVLAELRFEALEWEYSVRPELLEELEMLGSLVDEESGRSDDRSETENVSGIKIENLLEEVNRELGFNEKRTESLITLIREHPAKSVLVFANSVDHAEILAAKLNLRDIRAVAIHGNTPLPVRRHFIESFRRGEIRVLCNYHLVSTGFDAPKVDLVIIARVVWSRVRYMQMVGRGLRGPKNGGTETCDIRTVIDNLGRFRERHPWAYARKYFEEARIRLRTGC